MLLLGVRYQQNGRPSGQKHKGERMPTKYAIEVVRFADYYENAQSRKYKKLSWVPIPNRMDGKGYRRLTAMPDATEIFAAWILIVEQASKETPRGFLIDEDGPMDASDMAAKSGFPESIFERAFEVLSDESAKIKWIRKVPWPLNGASAGSALPAASTPAGDGGVEQNRIEQKRTEKTSPTGDAGILIDKEAHVDGAYPLPEDVYVKHPALRILHHATPYLRSLTHEHYLTAIRARSPYMDFEAAAREVSRRAELDGDIRKPGLYIDTVFGYWEKAHSKAIGTRKDNHARANKAFEEIVDFIVECGVKDAASVRQLDRYCRDNTPIRQRVLAEVEKRSLATT